MTGGKAPDPAPECTPAGAVRTGVQKTRRTAGTARDVRREGTAAVGGAPVGSSEEGAGGGIGLIARADGMDDVLRKQLVPRRSPRLPCTSARVLLLLWSACMHYVRLHNHVHVEIDTPAAGAGRTRKGTCWCKPRSRPSRATTAVPALQVWCVL